MPAPPRRRTLQARLPYDLVTTFAAAAHAKSGPSQRVAGGALWRATRNADGPVTLRLRQEGDRIHGEAWGPGAERALAAMPALVGLEDDSAGEFEPSEEPMRSFHRRFPGLRVPRTGAVFETLVPVIVTQKVIGKEAGRSYRALVHRFSEPAPGPADLMLPPAPEVLAAQPYEVFHPLGIEKRRADTIKRVAAVARRLEEILELDRKGAWLRLTSISGVGEWTAAKVLYSACGDADAVHVGDFHLPSIVAWNLAAEPRADDERMLELLEPYRGHRGRAARLIELAGQSPPRFGPRLELRALGRE